VDINIQELTAVDKEVIIKANREDLAPNFEKAYKKYRSQINMPGFRPGKVPVGIIKKRFGKEIEAEEINKYVQQIFEKEVVPEHEPVGESQMTDLQWEDDKLEVTFKIGAKPEFEITGLGNIEVNKLVHDVTDKEVEEEINRTLQRQGNFEDIDAPAEKDSRVIVDVVSLDEEGNEIEEEKDENQAINLSNEGAKEFREKLAGKKAGDVVDMELGEGDDLDRFRVTIKKVQKVHKAELTEEFIKEQSNGEAENEDEFKSYIKSQMQQYFDQSSEDMFRNELISQLVDAHEFDVPEVFLDQVLNSYVDYARQQSGGELPEDFDEETYKENMKDRALQEAKWTFINQKLQETFDDIEIKPEDIDAFISSEAAKYGATPDQLKSYYAQNPNQLESLRNTIRESKVFDKLQEEVNIKELSKDEYRKEQENKDKANT